jgi:type I restriction enzyme S subunit
VSIGDLQVIPVVVPGLPEQRRIADILDKADALRAKRRAALAQLDNLARATFRKTFLDKFEGVVVDVVEQRPGLAEGWSWELLTNVARLATGHTPDRNRPDYWDGDIPWISLTDIRELDRTVAKRTRQSVSASGIENSSAVKLPPGTVCFSRTASLGFVTMMGRDMATSQDFVSWVCGPKLDPTYLMWALLHARERLRPLSSGSTHKTIYMRVVEQFRVLVPPLDLQRQFAKEVEGIRALESPLRSGAAQIDALFASLQHRAFRGEL